MNYKQAERHYQQLQHQREEGILDTETFRVEVAKLLLRDERGVFWMLDADDGLWYCNRGEGWIPDDPHAQRPLDSSARSRRRAKRRRAGQVAILLVALVIVVGAVGVLAWLQWPPGFWHLIQPLPTSGPAVQVIIASPVDGGEVPLGQEVGIESMLSGSPDLQTVAQVELSVDGQVVESRQVQPKLQPDQSSLPLSLPWRPNAAGQHQVSVTARSDTGEAIGMATITIQVAETLSGPPCTPGATFLADVTIPPGTAFPPGVRMEKVWQVSNSGTCAWGVGYELVLVEGEGLGAPSAVPAPPTATGASADLAVTFWAPAEAGGYVSVWQLQAPDGTFFGPRLTLDILVEALAQESRPPDAPTNLQASLTEAGNAVRLTWTDQSQDEDAFRIYREDVAASIGLAPADAQLFVDGNVACGNTYRYAVVAFNAAGASAINEMTEVALPACAPIDAPPTITLTVTPARLAAGDVLTITFEAADDLQVAEVHIRGEETADPILDDGRVFACGQLACSGSWSITLAEEISGTLTLVAVARDSSGQQSEPARNRVRISPPELPPPTRRRMRQDRNDLLHFASIPVGILRPCN